MAACAVALSAGSALAGPAVTASWNGFSDGSVNGTLHYAPTGLNEGAAIGRFSINLTDAASSVQTIQAFCVDIFHYLTLPATYQIGVMQDSFSAEKVAQVNALLANGASLITGGVSSAALQLAIWEVVNEKSSDPTAYSLTAGDFTVTDTDSGAVSQATTWLGKLADGTWKANSAYAVSEITSDGTQTLVYLTQVPEPASLSILGLGIAGLGLYRRRTAASQRAFTGRSA